MGKSKEDDDVTGLLTKLYTIQEDIGAVPKTTDAEKLAKAGNVAKMGSGKKAEKKGSQFLELKSSIVDRLRKAQQLLKDSKELEGSGYGGDNAKDIIKIQAEIRENVRQATDEWRKLEKIYQKEARKKKSKFTLEELEVQSELVKRLYAKIEEVKEIQTKGYSKSGNNRDAAAAALNTKAMSYDRKSSLVVCLYRVIATCSISSNAISFCPEFHSWKQIRRAFLGRNRRRCCPDWRPTATNPRT
jgi:hypothetical protein